MLQKIDDYRWLVPKTGNMKVEGLIYASENMLSSIEGEDALGQVSNVATLPGIVGRSMAMPDIHWGYGFPIGGVAAMDIEEGGVISPGGVGYDINCLSGNTLVLHEFGFNLKIADFEEIWKNEKIQCFDFNEKKSTNTQIINFLKRKSIKAYKINTKRDRSIIATEDHPFYTKDGMRKLKDLHKDSEVAVFPFNGVPFEKPSKEVILSEEKLRSVLISLNKGSQGNGLLQILAQFKKKGLLPLRYDSPQLPYLLKIMGFVLGDGSIYFVNKTGKGITWFYGLPGDLQDIKKNIETIGFKCPSIYTRTRNHVINTNYDKIEFSAIENSCKVTSSSFAGLLIALGVPFGNKARQDFRIPEWIFRAPLWQKRLFLASYFGAEMSTPKSFHDNGYNFYCPVVSLNKTEKYIESGEAFLTDISSLLKDFGVKTNKISKKTDYKNKNGDISYKIKLILSGKPEDLINLYSRVGFEFNNKRTLIANFVVEYLKYKKTILDERTGAAVKAREIKELVGAGKGIKYVLSRMEKSGFVNSRFIERSIYEGRKTNTRISFNSQEFPEFVNKLSEGLGDSGMVWDEIERIEEIDFNDYVYDFTVNHHNHNFIANGFVVSNCGIRALRTNLKREDVEKNLPALVSALFNNIPSGIGSTGRIKLSAQEVKKVLEKGTAWALGRGYGDTEDAPHTEENGQMESANPDTVSHRAIERGMEQLGTLGAGNHFLEIQVVDEIFDEKAAEVFGLFRGQVVTMIHTGSRGLGYQVCDDFLKVMGNAVHKYNIELPDRQLACAPVKSDEGRKYLGAMAAAANYAWANRQCITHWTRETFQQVLGISPKALGMELVYDVAHNIAKLEEHAVDGRKKKLCVHRKGATRSFPAGNPDVPDDYKEVGQPVIIPGTMGTSSYIMVGTDKAMEETWGSTCHGAGRMMSRTKAHGLIRGEELQRQLAEKNILVQAKSFKTLAEEAPGAYKNIDEVVKVCDNAGISKKVARLLPIAVIKG